MDLITVLVVDDEAPARRRLVRQLERLGGVALVGEAGEGEQALAMIRAHAPDLVLLDIDMPEMDGLELAEQPGMPAVIFTTAHAEHALRAFELAALDYLQKPIAAERLAAALARARERIGLRRASASVEVPRVEVPRVEVPRVEVPRIEVPRVVARSGTSVHVIDAREVQRFHATDKVTIFVHEGVDHELDDSLGALEQRLAPYGFFRTHRAELVNLAAVKALHGEAGSASVELRDGTRAAVGRRTLGELKRRLGIT
jgi:two-component system LytT family response regulator